MTDEQLNERFAELYVQFTLLQARDCLRKAEARLKALPKLVMFSRRKSAKK